MTDADGRAGQEAARLLAAAQAWLRTSAPHLAPLGQDGEPCSCPLCRAVVGLREADPESVARWVDTTVAGVSSALAQAATLAADRSRTGDRSAAPDDGSDPGPDLDAEDDDASGPRSSADEHPVGGAVGHDGSAERRVRRIPLDGDVGPDLH